MTKRSHKEPVWVRLERLGLHEFAMKCQVQTLRSLANTRQGPLSAKRRDVPSHERALALLTKIAKAVAPEDRGERQRATLSLDEDFVAPIITT